MTTLTQNHSRRAAAMNVIRRRKTTHLTGTDVVDRCTRCGGPIFKDSKNVKNSRGLHVDNTPRRRHEKCPETTQ